MCTLGIVTRVGDTCRPIEQNKAQPEMTSPVSTGELSAPGIARDA